MRWTIFVVWLLYLACSVSVAPGEPENCSLVNDTAASDVGSVREPPRVAGNVLLQRSFDIKPKMPRIHIHTHIFGHRGHVGAEQSTSGKKVECRKPILARNYDPDQPCPSSCPYWAEDNRNGQSCRFQCVAASECGSLGRNATVADTVGMNCRTCMVPNCKQCVHVPVHVKQNKKEAAISINSTIAWTDWLFAPVDSSMALPEEHCIECADGYTLVQGRCRSHTSWVWNVVFVVVGLILLFFVAWYVHLRFIRPIENMEGLEHGLKYRSRTRLHVTCDNEGSEELWPLTTNLCSQDVAGPGLALFFHFHRHIIVWSFIIAMAWMITAHAVSKDLLVIGTMAATTPQQLCSVIKWGHEYQLSTMWIKVIFIFFTYLGTFIASLAHAGLQLRRAQSMEDATTMRDFAAFCSGVPKAGGFASDTIEEELSTFVQSATGEKVVGASICWSYGEDDRTTRVREISERDIAVLHHRHKAYGELSIRGERSEDSSWTKMFKKVDWLLGFEAIQASSEVREPRAPLPSPRAKEGRTRDRSPGPLSRPGGRSTAASAGQKDDSDHSVDPVESVVMSTFRDEATLLRSIETSGDAFIVFETELSRDLAVEKMQKEGGAMFGESRLQLQPVDFEPDTVLWENCAWPRDRHHVVMRLCLGILAILVALTLWSTCFYLPYAYYTLSFSYARGEMPGFLASTIFTMLVVAGNQIMYFLCSAVTGYIRFRCQDTFELTYMVLYTFACMVNLFFDLVVTFYTTYVTMVGMHVHTHDGRILEELSYFELFVSYPMQRALGHQLFCYAFPSCFLLPFILEPLFAIWLPFHIAKLIVRSDSDFHGYNAEQALEYFCPMDLSRYADILLNVCIAVTILLFPGGYVLQTFGVLCASHIYMYIYDHYRVLRECPGFDLGTDMVDQCMNMLMAFPCCILLALLIFKIHCLEGYENVSTWRVCCEIVLATTVHTIVHICLLIFVIPCCGREHRRSESTYAECAARLPCSWFNSNTLHCLRSKYIYHHKSHLIPYVRGKEHLQIANPALGAHYQGSSHKLMT